MASFRKEFEFAGPGGAVSAVDVDPTGRIALVGTAENWVYRWDIGDQGATAIEDFVAEARRLIDSRSLTL